MQNSLSDEGANKLFKAIAENPSISSVNLALNNLTEKSLDNIMNHFSEKLKNVLHIYLNQNSISLAKVNLKIKDLKTLKNIHINL